MITAAVSTREALELHDMYNPNAEHPNDHFVYLKRRVSHLETIQNNTTDLFSGSRKSIGSYFASRSSPAIGTGLTIDETKLLLPDLLQIPATDNTFLKTVALFYTEFFTPIPHGTEGLRLNVGLSLSNKMPVGWKNDEGETNMPLKLIDFLKFRHALGHPKVARSYEASLTYQQIMFYFEDKEQNAKLEVITESIKDEAMMIYLKIKDNKGKVDMLLTLLGVDPIAYVANKVGDPVNLLKLALKKQSSDNATAFVKAYKTEMFEQKYILYSFINANIWRRMGLAIVDSANNGVIANTETDALVWMQLPANSSKMSLYKIKLGEYLGGVIHTTNLVAAAEAKDGETTANSIAAGAETTSIAAKTAVIEDLKETPKAKQKPE